MTSIAPHPITATVLGYPRIGRHRELKRATEGYWAGAVTAQELLTVGATLRRRSWQSLAAAGISEVPVNDFSFYDHVADMIQLVGAVPQRHRVTVEESAPSATRQQAQLDEYFTMARGTDTATPLEMTKWFDTNYHYLIPELGPHSTFRLSSDKPTIELREAQNAGMNPRPVLLGPVTFLQLAKPEPGLEAGFQPLELLYRLLPVYEQLLSVFAELGAEWVQIDEPILIADPDRHVLDAARQTLDYLASVTRRPKLLIATYFGAAEAALPILRRAAVEGVALDFTGPARRNLELLSAGGGLPGKRLVAGVVDGRNIWANDLTHSAATLQALRPQAEQLVVSTSSSLLHVPIDVRLETGIEASVRPWLAFAEQKLDELAALTRATTSPDSIIDGEFADNQHQLAARRRDPLVHNEAVRDRVTALTAEDLRRDHPAAERVAPQQTRLALPLLPTTTIGSFPQTAQLRAARAGLRHGSVSTEQYEQRIAAEIEHVIALQEAIGLDVLVHGEPERNDMVQYFAEQLTGFLATEHGWVQSYGTRYVRPPILLGDVYRPEPMTVRWASYAQRLTERPVKGMLTGPVTMLAWSFVRDDQPLSDTARQVALALRDEIADLEHAGIAIIQVDEPGLRETLPLQSADHPAYLRWAVEAFRLATAGVRDDTQIHTHMCYAEFGDIMDAINNLDVDVISLEAARSHAQTTLTLGQPGHSYGVGPGVYDIHAPRIPPAPEIAAQLRTALRQVPAGRLWANPDCGLKTRTEAQVTQALRNMVRATLDIRAELTTADHR
jgi:5-methyltetrahydropteroyltriglutamate--homocysteine methyltransferase